jgi:glycerophosphoryl diester phosphodiesterase
LFEDRFTELSRRRPLILGHRGSPHLAPENSLDSFRLALEQGADGVELDVQSTSDGVLVAHHDAALPSGELISSLPYHGLLPLARRAGFEPPVLSDVFKALSGRGLLNIELKRLGLERQVATLARDLLPAGTFALSSFHPQAVKDCRRLAPDVPAFLIVWGPRHAARDIALIESLGASGIAFENNHGGGELVAAFRERHLPIFAWTVNDGSQALGLAKAGVTGLITDEPGKLVKLFAAEVS